MRKNKLLTLIGSFCLILVLAALPFMAACPAPAEEEGPTAEPIVWKLQLAFPGSLWEGELDKLAKMVEENTDGRLVIEVLSSGAVLKAPEILDGVSKGVVQAGASASIYYAGKIPELNLAHGIPFLYHTVDQNIELVYEYENGELFKLLKEAFRAKGNVLYLGYSLTSSNGLFGNFPVYSLDDFKGKKIRSTGLANGLLAQLETSTVSFPGSEHYTAFQRGTIDGTIYPLRSIKDYGLAEVVTYRISPAFYPGTEFGLYCNFEAFNALPDEVRAILEETCIDWSKNVMTKDFERIDKEYLEWIDEAGVKELTLSDEDVDKLRQLTIEEALPPYVEKSADCEKVWDLIEGYAKETGLLK